MHHRTPWSLLSPKVPSSGANWANCDHTTRLPLVFFYLLILPLGPSLCLIHPIPWSRGICYFQVSSLKIERGGVSLSLAILPPDCSIKSYPVSQNNNSDIFLLQMHVTMSSVPGLLEHVPGSLKKSVQTRRPQAPRLSEQGLLLPRSTVGSMTHYDKLGAGEGHLPYHTTPVTPEGSIPCWLHFLHMVKLPTAVRKDGLLE